MNPNFDFDTAETRVDDALALIETVAELLYPLTDTPNPSPADLYDITRRARMIDATIRAARDKAADALAMFHAAEADQLSPAV